MEKRFAAALARARSIKVRDDREADVADRMLLFRIRMTLAAL